MNFKHLIVVSIFGAITVQTAKADELLALAKECAPTVHPKTMAAVIGVESSYNPYAIGVVDGRLEHQPLSKAEAIATAHALEDQGFNFSLGVGQVNRYNLSKYGLDYETAFDPCANIRAGSQILTGCFDRAKKQYSDDQQALQASFSCYYSGNFKTGFKPDFKGQPSYVQKVLNKAAIEESPKVPAIQPIPVIHTASAEAAVTPKQSQSTNDGVYRVKLATQQRPSNAAQYSVYGTAETDSVMVFR